MYGIPNNQLKLKHKCQYLQRWFAAFKKTICKFGIASFLVGIVAVGGCEMETRRVVGPIGSQVIFVGLPIDSSKSVPNNETITERVQQILGAMGNFRVPVKASVEVNRLYDDKTPLEQLLEAQVTISYELTGTTRSGMVNQDKMRKNLTRDLVRWIKGREDGGMSAVARIANDRGNWEREGVIIALSDAQNSPLDGRYEFVAWRYGGIENIGDRIVLLVCRYKPQRANNKTITSMALVHAPKMEFEFDDDYILIVRIDDFKGTGEWVRTKPLLCKGRKGNR